MILWICERWYLTLHVNIVMILTSNRKRHNMWCVVIWRKIGKTHTNFYYNNVWWTTHCSNLHSILNWFIEYVRCKKFQQVKIQWKNGAGHYLILSNQRHDILSSTYFCTPSPIIIFIISFDLHASHLWINKNIYREL